VILAAGYWKDNSLDQKAMAPPLSFNRTISALDAKCHE